jgi:DNA-binding protein HU-beta
LQYEERTVTKADLIDALANEYELSKREADGIIGFVLESIMSTLASGEKVQLIPFGAWNIRERKRREGRNPQTGERLMIAARRVPAFTAGKALREAVAGGKKKRSTKR